MTCSILTRQGVLLGAYVTVPTGGTLNIYAASHSAFLQVLVFSFQPSLEATVVFLAKPAVMDSWIPYPVCGSRIGREESANTFPNLKTGDTVSGNSMIMIRPPNARAADRFYVFKYLLTTFPWRETSRPLSQTYHVTRGACG